MKIRRRSQSPLCGAILTIVGIAAISLWNLRSLRSGIKGQIVAVGTPPVQDGIYDGTPMTDTAFFVYRLDGYGRKLIARSKTDASGNFEMQLPPGNYSVKAQPLKWLQNQEVKVQVVKDRFCEVRATLNWGW